MISTHFPIIWAIGKNTYKEIIRDRLLYGILVIALLVTASSFFLASISFEQNSRIIQNVGLASIHFFTLFITIFVATNSISKDFERRALYLLFSKPISRSHYILGKYLGLVLLLLTTLLILGGLFSLASLFVDKNLLPIIGINLAFSLAEISLLIAVAVLFASFAAPLNAALYTLALFIIGHSLGAIREYVEKLGNKALEIVINLCYYVLPNLEKFDVRSTLLYGLQIPNAQFLWAALYWIVFSFLALYLAILTIKQREV